MEKNNLGLQSLSFEKNNHSIVYAPNSTGKTRLTRKLSKSYADRPAMFFTLSEIDSMLNFSGRNIFVGFDSALRVENENIIKDFNKNKFGDELLKLYDVKNASTLTKRSCLFSVVGLKRKDTFEIYSKLRDFQKDFVLDNFRLNWSQMMLVDKLLVGLDLNDVRRISSESIKTFIFNNENTISQELKDKLQSIYDSIDSYKRFCPLCGHEFSDNRDLKEAIKNVLNNYVVNSNAHDYEVCVNFLNVLNNINRNLGFEYFYSTHEYDKGITNKLLVANLNAIDEFLDGYCKTILKKIDSGSHKELFELYRHNLDSIDYEDKQRKNSVLFLKNVVDKLNELITLPDGYSFVSLNDRIEILDSLGKSTNPEDFLSESEQRRMCISIVFVEINQRGLEYIVFDDPVDSNDDYYFDISVDVIGDLLLKNQSLNWIVLTHEFRMVSILSDRCRTSEDEFSKNVDFLFYLPDPSFSQPGLPPFSLVKVKPDSLKILNEHETIIFKKIFMGRTDYQCDKNLALLASFNTARNLYNEILENHRISKHKLKQFKDAIDMGNSSYEHYRKGTLGIMRLSTLYRLNKFMYVTISPSYA